MRKAKRYFIAGRSNGCIVFWHYGLPQWYWHSSQPDQMSAKPKDCAQGIMANMEGKPVTWPASGGAPVRNLYLVEAD
jgi:hypothetical protein